MLTKQEIPKEELEKILGQYDFGEIIGIESISTSGNFLYKIKTENSSYILRFNPLGVRWRSKEEIESEVEILQHLYKNNFPVSKIIKTRTNEFVVGWDGRFGYLREFVDAHAKEDPTLEELRTFGETIGWMHSLTKDFKTKHVRKHVWGLENTKAYFEKKKQVILSSDYDFAKEFVNQVEFELEFLNFPNSLPQGILHEDLGKRHVLWQGSKIVSILDFDRAYFGTLLLDLGQAARGWCFIDDWKQWDKTRFQALLEGYETKRKLTKEERNLVPDAIRFALVERAISFMLRAIEITKDDEDAEFAWRTISKLLPQIRKPPKEAGRA